MPNFMWNTFAHQAILHESLVLNETNRDGQRYYILPDGTQYQSVTSFLAATNTDKKDGLLQWQERLGKDKAQSIATAASNQGTKMHQSLEKILNNQWSTFDQLATSSDVQRLLRQVVPTLQEHVSMVYAQERQVYSHRLKLAGRLDLFGLWDGIPCITDFKRSNKPKRKEHIMDYFLQSTIYALALEELNNLIVPSITILIAVDDFSITKPQVFHEDKQQFIPELNRRIERFATNKI